MRKSIVACLTAIAAIPVFAGGFGLKAGLWEMRIVKQVVDGQDKTGELAGASSRMQQAMANMPPEQRARMEAMMKEHGGPAMGSNGTFRMCVSPEMANRDQPVVDREGHCQPAIVNHSGNRTSFTITCNTNGNVSTGKGEALAAGDLITSQMDMTTKMANGETHVRHSETEMKFLGSDCGDVKPMPMPKSAP